MILSELSHYLSSLFDPSYILHNLVDSATSPSKFKVGQILRLHIHIETRVVLLTDSKLCGLQARPLCDAEIKSAQSSNQESICFHTEANALLKTSGSYPCP